MAKHTRPRQKVWAVLEYGEGFKPTGKMEFICPNCRREAYLPVSGHPGTTIIAQLGMGFITDPPDVPPRDGWLPAKIRCRMCQTVYEQIPAHATADETAAA